MQYKAGQHVQCVVEDGLWSGAINDRHWVRTGYKLLTGRVMSQGDGVVVVWLDEGAAPLFAAASDVFGESDNDGAWGRVRSLESGMKEGDSR